MTRRGLVWPCMRGYSTDMRALVRLERVSVARSGAHQSDGSMHICSSHEFATCESHTISSGSALCYVCAIKGSKGARRKKETWGRPMQGERDPGGPGGLEAFAFVCFGVRWRSWGRVGARGGPSFNSNFTSTAIITVFFISCSE